MKIKRYVLIVIAVIVLGVTIITLLNPLRKSEEKIREDLLNLMPLGTSMEETIKVVKSHPKWEIERIDDDYGYETDIDGVPGEYDGKTDVGEKSMRICMGKYNYRILSPAYMIVYFGFDKDSKLTDIAVRKDIDML